MMLLSCFLSLLQFSKIIADSGNQKSILFDDVRPGKKLAGCFLGFYPDVSKVKCAKICFNHQKCSSFNYYRTKTCELNSGDAFWNASLIQDDLASQYVGVAGQMIPAKEVI